jgi:hypothetical protein
MMLISKTVYNKLRGLSLIPVDNNCPFLEAIYDPQNKVLAVLSKETRQVYDLFPKLTEYGQNQTKNGKTLLERRAVDNYHEYYVTERTDIESFIKMFAVNHKDFPYQEILNQEVEKTADEKIAA